MRFNKPFSRCHWHTDRYDQATLALLSGLDPDMPQDTDLNQISDLPVPQSYFKKRISPIRIPKRQSLLIIPEIEFHTFYSVIYPMFLSGNAFFVDDF